MDNILLYIALTVLIPIIILFIFLEKHARRIMLCFMYGVFVCLGAYYASIFVRDSGLEINIRYSLFFSPVIEEILKFIPLLIIGVVLKKGRKQTVARAFALGVGFCVIENLFYLFNNIYSADAFWIIARSIGTGLMHSMSATVMAFGIYEGRIRNKTALFSLLSLLIAIFYHGLYNNLVENPETQILGVCIPVISVVGLVAYLKKARIKAFFEDDEDSAG